ncbi:MAG: riboflavin synthase [Oleiphilaceae bacterium]|jgi:riboflavin synthase
MFTGIVQGQAILSNKQGNNQLSTLTFKFPTGTLKNIKEGASVAINGTCLTVISFDLDGSNASFDAIEETLRLTNLGELEIGHQVNFERAAKIGDEIGGHSMSGHIYCAAEIIKIIKTEKNCSLFFKLSKKIQPYLLNKGYVGLNGCSLTIGEVTNEYFNVYLIPETLKITTFGTLSVGQKVNLEIDSQTQAIVDTVEKILASKTSA